MPKRKRMSHCSPSAVVSIHQIISVPRVVAKITKYLESPSDILSCRLVSRVWTAGFEKAFLETVPVILNDLDIKAFTMVEGGTIRPRRMKNEIFDIRAKPRDEQRITAMLDLCNTFSGQIKKLHVVLDVEEPNDMKMLSEMLEHLKDTLEELNVRLETHLGESRSYSDVDDDDDDEDGDEEDWKFPVMSALKSLSFSKAELQGTVDEFNCNRYVLEYGGLQEAEASLIEFVTTSCPALTHLRVCGFPLFQQELFKQLKTSYMGNIKLETLEIDQCPVALDEVMQDLTQINFTGPLKNLRFIPSTYEGKNRGISFGEYPPRVPPSISKFLKHVSNDLIHLDLRLKTMFPEKRRWGGIVREQEMLTLPVMPKLKFLYVSVQGEGSCIALRFERSFVNNPKLPSLKEMYPALVSLRFSFEPVDLSLILTNPESPHDGVRQLDVVDLDIKRLLIFRKKCAKAFPNADVFFLKTCFQDSE